MLQCKEFYLQTENDYNHFLVILKKQLSKIEHFLFSSEHKNKFDLL